MRWRKWQGKVGGDFPLESSCDNSVGEKGKRRERKIKKNKKRKKRKERGRKRRMGNSTFSLDFTEIRLPVFVGVIGKVYLCDKSSA